MKQPSLFEGMRQTLPDSIALSLQSLRHYGEKYPHWAIAYSGGKDSSATTSFVAWAILTGQIPAPQSLTVLYSDTRLELPPLQQIAMGFMGQLRQQGFNAEVVLPQLDDRFFPYLLGRGVPPPKNRFRWCTPQLKIEPMHAALADQREKAGRKLLMLTGVRQGESAARDQRIAVSCSKDSGECGQGWMQVATPEALADTLAPLFHWRACHVWDWLFFHARDTSEMKGHGYQGIGNIAVAYGEDEDGRTGCVGCNLASKDTALENIIRTPEWAHLAPLRELKPLYAELTKAKHRHRKSEPQKRKDGGWGKNVQRLGPLTLKAREWGLERVLDIQRRARVDLINDEEQARICELIAAKTYPNGWSGDEIVGDVPIDSIKTTLSGELVTQPLLV